MSNDAYDPWDAQPRHRGPEYPRTRINWEQPAVPVAPPVPPPPARRRWYRRSWVLLAAGLLLGFAGGLAADGGPPDPDGTAAGTPVAADAAAGPATPGSCLRAIDLARAGKVRTPAFEGSASHCRSKAAIAPAAPGQQPATAAGGPTTTASPLVAAEPQEATRAPQATRPPVTAPPEPTGQPRATRPPAPEPPATGPPATRPPATRAPAANCDPSYPDFCIPPSPPDLNCDDVDGKNFTVRPPDRHGFDREGDGVGCET